MGEPALGIDLGGTNVRAALVDRETGRVLSLAKRALAGHAPEEVAAAVAKAARSAAGARELASFTRAGAGVAGQVLGKSGLVLNAPNLGWRDVAFGEMLGRALGMPVRIVNDLSAAAWGESRFGAAKGARDALVVFVGTGVGSGIVLGGRLQEGARGVAGEIGHVKVRPPRPGEPPRPCGCGAVGCLEAYAGGARIAARVREEIGRGGATRIAELAGGDLAAVTASAVERAAAADDEYARELWAEVGELLGTAVANAVTILNPARLVLGGGVLRSSPSLRAIVVERVAAAASRSAAAELAIAAAELGDEAGVVGAALLGAGIEG
ncbi:MAG TPA: ROK family protein [Anaeromyxobacteraceae bacterium]|nr:ROK family protein [Anaeromyxobacteraceae bacterium]